MPHAVQPFLAPQKKIGPSLSKGPAGKEVPNLTPARLKKWSDAELKESCGGASNERP